MKQQKRRWTHVLFTVALAIAFVLPVFGPATQVAQAAPPPGRMCPAPYTWTDGQNRCDAVPIGEDQCPGGGNYQSVLFGDARCEIGTIEIPAGGAPGAPPGAGVPLNQGGIAGENQEACDAERPGTVWIEGNCVSPLNKDQCPQGTTFEQGNMDDQDPENNNKCNPDDQDNCIVPTGTAIGSTALRWMACPFIEIVNVALLGCSVIVPEEGRTDNTADANDGEEGDNDAGGASCDGGLNGLVRGWLYVDSTSIFDIGTMTGAAYYESWGVFRALGVGLIVIAGLIMIVSEAFGVGFVDAYTIRKLLPRLLVAAVGITLSWWICAFLIVLFNDLGSWAEDLIKFPFTQINDGINAGGVWGIAAAAGQWLAIGGAVAIGVIFWPTTLLLLLLLLLALLVAAAVLILRQMVIVLCILVAPLAIACSVLPNTQKVFSMWANTFIRTLMMYPVVMAFLAVGVVFSWLASRQDTLGAGIIGFIALILPYFFMPYAFKLSGGLMATAAGLVGDKAGGVFKAGRDRAKSNFADRGQRFLHGELYNPKKKNGLAQKMNSFGETLGAMPSGFRFERGGKFGLRRNHAAMDSAKGIRKLVRAAEMRDKNGVWKATSAQDEQARGMGYGSAEEAYQELYKHNARIMGVDRHDKSEGNKRALQAVHDKTKQEVETIRRGVGFNSTVQATSAHALAAAGTALYSKDEDGNDQVGAAVHDLVTHGTMAANGNNTVRDAILAQAQSEAGRAGRPTAALGAGYVVGLGQAYQKGMNYGPGKSNVQDSGGVDYSGDVVDSPAWRAAHKVRERNDMRNVLNAKGMEFSVIDKANQELFAAGIAGDIHPVPPKDPTKRAHQPLDSAATAMKFTYELEANAQQGTGGAANAYGPGKAALDKQVTDKKAQLRQQKRNGEMTLAELKDEIKKLDKFKAEQQSGIRAFGGKADRQRAATQPQDTA